MVEALQHVPVILFTCFIRDAPEVFCRSSQSLSDNYQLETCVMLIACKNDMPVDKRILKLKNGSYKQLVSMGMSSLISSLFCDLPKLA